MHANNVYSVDMHKTMSKLDLSVLRNILHYYCVRICRHWFFVGEFNLFISANALYLGPFLAAGVPHFTKSLVPILKLEVRVPTVHWSNLSLWSIRQGQSL